MDLWHRTLQLSLCAVHCCIFILSVGLDFRVIEQVVASEDLNNNNGSTVKCVGKSCQGSNFDRRLQSSLTIGGVCLVLLVTGGCVFAYCIRKGCKQSDDTTNKGRKKKKRKKPVYDQKQKHEAVFTISNEQYVNQQYVTMEESTTEGSDKINLVLPDSAIARQSRHHMEETFNSYGKPVDCEEQGT